MSCHRNSVRNFERLTELGQSRRLRRVARKAIRAYDLSDADMHLAGTSSNAMGPIPVRKGVRAFGLAYGFNSILPIVSRWQPPGFEH